MILVLCLSLLFRFVKLSFDTMKLNFPMARPKFQLQTSLQRTCQLKWMQKATAFFQLKKLKITGKQLMPSQTNTAHLKPPGESNKRKELPEDGNSLSNGKAEAQIGWPQKISRSHTPSNSLIVPCPMTSKMTQHLLGGHHMFKGSGKPL